MWDNKHCYSSTASHWPSHFLTQCVNVVIPEFTGEISIHVADSQVSQVHSILSMCDPETVGALVKLGLNQEQDRSQDLGNMNIWAVLKAVVICG